MSTSWQLLITEAESIINGMKDHGKYAHRMAQIVRELWNHRKYLNEKCNGVMDKAEDELSAFSGFFGFGLNEIIQMIEHFPDVSDWENCRLDRLRNKTSIEITQRQSRFASSGQSATATASQNTKPVKRERYDRVVGNNISLHQQLANLKKENIELKKENAELRKQNRILKHKLNGRHRQQATA